MGALEQGEWVPLNPRNGCPSTSAVGALQQPRSSCTRPTSSTTAAGPYATPTRPSQIIPAKATSQQGHRGRSQHAPIVHNTHPSFTTCTQCGPESNVALAHRARSCAAHQLVYSRFTALEEVAGLCESHYSAQPCCTNQRSVASYQPVEDK
jgi:hypothetical protein